MKKLNAKYLFLIWIVFFSEIIYVPVAHSEENQVVAVTPPAIIAIIYNPKTTPKDEFNVVSDDFSFHLSSAIQKLKPYGIKIYTLEKQKVFFNFLNMTDSIDLAKENALVGYVFISSKGEVLKRFHVLSDIDIIETAEKFFDLKKQSMK